MRGININGNQYIFKSKLVEMKDDEEHRTVTDEEKARWNNKKIYMKTLKFVVDQQGKATMLFTWYSLKPLPDHEIEWTLQEVVELLNNEVGPGMYPCNGVLAYQQTTNVPIYAMEILENMIIIYLIVGDPSLSESNTSVHLNDFAYSNCYVTQTELSI